MPRWRIRDLIDLEYLLQTDAREAADDEAARSLARRDREIWLKDIAPVLGERPSRSAALRRWLDRRRELALADRPDGLPLPGRAYADIRRALPFLFLLAGVVCGAGLASPLLAYTGREPLNVSVYLGVLVLTQLVILGLGTGLYLFRNFLGGVMPHGSLARFIFRRIFLRAMTRTWDKSRSSLSGDRRAALDAVRSQWTLLERVYGGILARPVFLLLQLFGVGFNLGVLAATLLRVAGTDLAFGWQSTLQVSPEAVFAVVSVIALPWSTWLPAGVGHPTLAQIEGSRMILKDGIYHLSTTDLVAWWPFLCLCVIVYGLLPRLLLFGAGLVSLIRSLNRLSFDHGECERLFLRMETPQVSTSGRPPERSRDGEPGIPETPEPAAPPPGEMTGRAVTVLVPDDIHAACVPADLDESLMRNLGCRLNRILCFGRDEEQNAAALKGAGIGDEPVVVMQEAWQPPIQETLTFLRRLRERSGERRLVVVGLVGKPSPRTLFTAAGPDHWRIWAHKLATLGDPRLIVERLTLPGSSADGRPDASGNDPSSSPGGS